MSDFTWIPIYHELAGKVLEFEDRQDALISILREVSDAGLPIISLRDKDVGDVEIDLDAIDPFTFFASFNRGITNARRLAIIAILSERWNLTSRPPDDFDGIPVVNNMKSWFFRGKHERAESAISNLWHLARECYQQPLERLPIDLLRTCIDQFSLRMLSMGMFWFNPNEYIAVDQVNRAYLKNFGINADSVRTADQYVPFVAKVREAVPDSFPSISKKAWLQANRPAPSVDPTPRVWTLGVGEGGAKWSDFLGNSLIAIDFEVRQDLSTFETKDEIKEALWPDGPGSKMNDSLACWQFVNDIKVGDYVFAKHGRGTLHGLARVTGEYEFRSERSDHPHVRSVEWISTGPWALAKDESPAAKTLTEITNYHDFVRALFSTVGVAVPNVFNLGPTDASESERLPGTRTYWWLNANPKIWRYDSLKIGETQTYTTHNPSGHKRQKYK